MNSNISHVAVIGAGMAGMTCAHALSRAGIHVQVFEKSRGIGGRMNTRRAEGWQCDLGAQYFTATTRQFQDQIDLWIADGTAVPWQPRLAVYHGRRAYPHRGKDVMRYVGAPKMNAMLSGVDGSFPLHRNTRVESLERRGGNWHLRITDGPMFPESFDAVVCAMPAQQAIPLVEPWSAELSRTASSVDMLPCWAAAAHFEREVRTDFDAAFINAGPLRWVARDDSKPNRPALETWLIHASPRWSKDHLESTAEDVSTWLTQSLEDLLGHRPSRCHAHRWRYADTAVPLHVGAKWDKDTKIGLCGDWLSTGKVEGAWRSGTLLAEQMIQS